MAANYVNRIVELRDLLGQIPAAANDQINQNMIACLDRYCSMRQSALEDLVDYMAKASASNMGTQSKWQSRIARVRSDYAALFSDAVRDLMLPPAHQLFWSATVDAEERFFDSLSRIATPQRMDDLVTHQSNLSNLAGALKDSWTFLLSQNDSIQTEEMRQIDDLDRMVQAIISDMNKAKDVVVDNAGRFTDGVKREVGYFKEGLKEMFGGSAEVGLEVAKKYVVDQMIKPDGTPDDVDGPAKAVFQYTGMIVDSAAEASRKYRALLASYGDLVNRQKGSVLTMFNSTRQQVDQYLSANDLSHAEVFVDQADGQLQGWASALPTSGQRSDAALFRDDVFKKLEIVWSRTTDLDQQFKSQFQGAFLSPVSNETREKLGQRYLFQEQLRRVNDRNVVDVLNQIRDRLPEQMKSMEGGLDVLNDPMELLNNAPSEVRDLLASGNRNFRDFVHDRIKLQIDALLPAVDDLKRTLAPSNLGEDFGREELESMLT
jgi:archaellum component FlaC